MDQQSRYLSLLARRWWVVLGITGIAVAAAALSLPSTASTAARSGSFSAVHTLLPSPGVVEEDGFDPDLAALFATTGEVPRQAAVSLGRPASDGPLLAREVRPIIEPDLAALRLVVRSEDPDRAAELANAFAEALKEYLRASAENERAAEVQSLQAQVAELESRIVGLGQSLGGAGLRAPVLEAERAALTTRYQSVFERLQALQSEGPVSSGLTTLEVATPLPLDTTSGPVPTSRSGRLVLIGLLGLVLGSAVVLLGDRLDTRIRTRQEVEEVSSLPVVAEVPQLDRAGRRLHDVVVLRRPTSAVAEAYRALRSSLLLLPVQSPSGRARGSDADGMPGILLVSSAAPGDGKTSTTVNLAAALAETGRRVVVLDADFRRPSAHRYLAVEQGPGLSDVLAGRPVSLQEVLRTTSVPGVRLMTSGTEQRHPAALLAGFGALVAEVAVDADVVLVDSPPLLVAGDVLDLVPHVDALLLVAQAGRTTASHLQRTAELLSRVDIPALGYVLQAAERADESVTGYYYGAQADPRPRFGRRQQQPGPVSAEAPAVSRPSTEPAPPSEPPSPPVAPPPGSPVAPLPVASAAPLPLAPPATPAPSPSPQISHSETRLPVDEPTPEEFASADTIGRALAAKWMNGRETS